MVSADRLLRALGASARAHGCAAELSLAATRDWASALFVGARYDVVAALAAGAAADAWIAALPEADLPMARQFASEVRIIARDDVDERTTVTIEALVLAEDDGAVFAGGEGSPKARFRGTFAGDSGE